MKHIIIYIIKVYQNIFPGRALPRCKYFPSCSEYALLAIEKYGIFLGIAKGLGRIIRCNPLSRGGFDMP